MMATETGSLPKTSSAANASERGTKVIRRAPGDMRRPMVAHSSAVTSPLCTLELRSVSVERSIPLLSLARCSNL